MILGGSTGSPSTNTDIIKYFDVASQGITETFGNLTDPDGNGRRSLASVSSSTRACTGGGYSHGGSPGTAKNIIDFVTIANTGNATDFGDMQDTAYGYGAASNQTRGLFAGGECTGGLLCAYRVGGNSLSDLLVFGWLSGLGAN